MLDLQTLESLRDADFEQPLPIARLRASKLFGVPTIRGVYLVLTAGATKPRFLKVGTGGHFKQRDPKVLLTELEAKWVPDALVLYVGKAGTTLRKRLDQYLKFGAGTPIGHRGGRYIWQIDGSERLRICWRTTPYDDPREVEKSLIKVFGNRYGRLPFANLRS
ncbi:MAG: hypothetical protein ACREJ0_25725 [Geminicoccaceae bacterium]